MTLTVLPDPVAICQLPPESPPPAWAWHGAFCSVTRTATEVSVITDATNVPSEVNGKTGWRVLAVQGPLPFDMIGVLASLSEPLAGAGVPIFSVSTFDTDYLLVEDDFLHNAVAALRMAGNTVAGFAESNAS